MNKVENLNRWWVDKDSGILVRPWTDEEYKIVNPHTHIFEKYWSYYCPVCGFIPVPTPEKAEAKRQQREHMNRFDFRVNRMRHKGFVKCRDHELVCLEHRDEFIEHYSAWVHVQEMY